MSTIQVLKSVAVCDNPDCALMFTADAFEADQILPCGHKLGLVMYGHGPLVLKTVSAAKALVNDIDFIKDGVVETMNAIQYGFQAEGDKMVPIYYAPVKNEASNE